MNPFLNKTKTEAEAILNKMLSLEALPQQRKDELKAMFEQVFLIPEPETNKEDKWTLSQSELTEIKNIAVSLKGFGIETELCGCYLWTISGDTRTFSNTLKGLGFKYAPKKQKWFFRNERHKIRKSRGEKKEFEEIENKYGAIKI